MLTAQDKLNQALISWHTLLSGWSLDGSLASTAEHVLNLDGENAIEGADALLQSHTSQWSLGDFESLPPIVLLSNDDISGARGAYAASTDTIYLNEDWLLSATDEQIIAVLTEELGAFLDDQLNTVDTQGDEGALFSAELLGVGLSETEVAAIQTEDDSVQITVDGETVEAEAFEAVKNLSSALSIDFEGGLIQDTSPSNSPVIVSGDVSIADSRGSFNGIDSGSRINSSSIDMSKDFSISLNLIWDREDDNNLTPIIDKRRLGLGPGGWSLRLIDGSISWEGESAIDGDYVFYAPLERDYQHTVEVNRIGGTLQFVVDDIVIDTKYDPTDYTNNNPINIANNKDFDPTFGANYFQGLLDNISIRTGELNYSEYFVDEAFIAQNSLGIYNGSIYLPVYGDSWEDAQHNSSILGGYLTSITSQEENEFIFEFFRDPTFFPEAWIGYSLDQSEQWTWTSGEATQYTKWRTGEPNNLGGIEDRAVINLRSEDIYGYSNGVWNDISNDGPLNQYNLSTGAFRGIAEIPYKEYNGSAYILTDKLSWDDAQSLAESLGGNLVTINDAEENAWIAESFQIENQGFWIGLKDVTGNNDWEWVSGEDFEYLNNSFYQNWAAGEPNDYLGIDEPWGQFYTNAGASNLGKWNDARYPTLRALIEIKLQEEPDPITGIFDGPGTLNLNDNGVAPFTLYGSDDISVSDIEVESLVFGGEESGIGVAQKKNDSFFASYVDVNGDGELDLVIKVQTSAFDGMAPTEPFEIFGSLNDGTQVVFGLNEGDYINFI